ncbi:PH domain-containing protein [Streptomyces sp. NPDC090442]|uniref:PH domain-containing protein n=1 Tax=Streptomyces sp. NPDC090442 TaxID=3365962 RepID=UPI0038060148
MQTIEYRAVSHAWQWGAVAFFVIGGILPTCFLFFGLGWGGYIHGFGQPRSSAAGQWSSLCTGGLVMLPVSLVAYYFTAGRTYVSAEGVRTRTPLRRRFIPWRDIRSVFVDDDTQVSYRKGRRGSTYRIRLDLVNDTYVYLPAPLRGEFDSALESVKSEIIHRWKAANASDPSGGHVVRG